MKEKSGRLVLRISYTRADAPADPDRFDCGDYTRPGVSTDAEFTFVYNDSDVTHWDLTEAFNSVLTQMGYLLPERGEEC